MGFNSPPVPPSSQAGSEENQVGRRDRVIRMHQGPAFNQEKFNQAFKFIEEEATKRGLALALNQEQSVFDGDKPASLVYQVTNDQGKILGSVTIEVAHSGASPRVMFKNEITEEYSITYINREEDMVKISAQAEESFNKWMTLTG